MTILGLPPTTTTGEVALKEQGLQSYSFSRRNYTRLRGSALHDAPSRRGRVRWSDMLNYLLPRGVRPQPLLVAGFVWRDYAKWYGFIGK